MVRGQGKNNKRKKCKPTRVSYWKKKNMVCDHRTVYHPTLLQCIFKGQYGGGFDNSSSSYPTSSGSSPLGHEDRRGLNWGTGQIPAPPRQAPRLTWKAKLMSCDQILPGRLLPCWTQAAGSHTAPLAVWHGTSGSITWKLFRNARSRAAPP